MTASPAMTGTDLIAAATNALIAGGYEQVHSVPEWDSGRARLFEDPYGVVGVVVFDTCGELVREWPNWQGSLVEVISKSVGREEAKAWEGYLVLLTPALAPSERKAIDGTRYDTIRLRKIVATGGDMEGTFDVTRVLSPLLPLGKASGVVAAGAILDLLPKLLAKQGISAATTQLVVDAFREQSSLLERLHSEGGQP